MEQFYVLDIYGSAVCNISLTKSKWLLATGTWKMNNATRTYLYNQKLQQIKILTDSFTPLFIKLILK